MEHLESHTLSGSDQSPDRGIGNDLDILDKATAQVHELLTALEQRLSPILRPQDGGEKALASVMGGPPSEVSQRIRSAAAGVGEARIRVEHMLERLDL